MPSNRFKLVLGGVHNEGGNFTVNALIGELKAIAAALGKIERHLRGESGRPTFYLRVISLSENSPKTIELEAVPRKPGTGNYDDILNKLPALIAAVERGEADSIGIDSDLLESLRDLSLPVGDKFEAVDIIISDTAISVSSTIAPKVEAALAEEEICAGYIRGDLDYINIHGGQNVFKIYPIVGPNKVLCRFLPEDKARAIAAVGRYIEVRGKLIFRSMDDHPYAIDVQEIEIIPPDDELPSFNDIGGIAPYLDIGGNNGAA